MTLSAFNWPFYLSNAFTLFLFSQVWVFFLFIVAVSIMTMAHNRETILPTAWQGQCSYYNSANADCCWQCGAHCHMESMHWLYSAHTINKCMHTRFRIEAWLQVYSCVFPSLVELTLHVPPSLNRHAGIWPVFFAHRETADFFSHCSCLHAWQKKVFTLPLKETSDRVNRMSD